MRFRCGTGVPANDGGDRECFAIAAVEWFEHYIVLTISPMWVK
ncbi:hypothetical protein STSO111631_12405 [Stackebrandtia soli]